MLERFGSRIIEITLVLVVLFLVLQNAPAFGQIAKSISDTYIGGVKALQGRG